MNDVIIFHLLIRNLRRILPPKEFDFLEQESKKLLYFEGAGYFEGYVFFTNMEKECLELYNEFRPITKIPDSMLIDMIYRHNEFPYPSKWYLEELLEDGDWMIDNQN